jgi:hypothetical protein
VQHHIPDDATKNDMILLFTAIKPPQQRPNPLFGAGNAIKDYDRMPLCTLTAWWEHLRAWQIKKTLNLRNSLVLK